MKIKHFTANPYAETGKKYFVEIFEHQKGKESILIEKRYFLLKKDAIDFMYKEQGD